MRFATLFLSLLFTTMPASAYWVRDCKTENVWSGQTKMVANINAGSADAVTSVFGFSHRHEHMIELNGTLYFQAENQSAGSELWRIKDDGLPAQVFDLATGSASSAFVVFNNQLYFAASSPQTAAAGPAGALVVRWLDGLEDRAGEGVHLRAQLPLVQPAGRLRGLRRQSLFHRRVAKCACPCSSSPGACRTLREVMAERIQRE